MKILKNRNKKNIKTDIKKNIKKFVMNLEKKAQEVKLKKTNF